MSKVILTSECETCRYGSIDDSNKARVKVHCSYKGKTYFYGQCVPCDNHEKRREYDT